MAWKWHRPLEAKQLLLAVLSFVLVSVGGLVLLIPPYFLQGTIPAIAGVKPFSALELEGRDLYIREGCNTCHSQQVRPFKTETAATDRSRWPARASTIGRSCGARGAPAPISRAWAESTRTPGTGCIS